MLDPFTALSLAASIAQFVDFGSKVVSEAYHIYQHESSTKSLIIGYQPERTLALMKNIKSMQLQLEQHDDSLSQAELALNKVAEASIEEARKLEAILTDIKLLQDKVEREQATIGGRLKAHLPATRAAFKTLWNLESIKQFDRRLRHIRQETDSHILVVLNAKLDRQDEQIVEVLTICNQLRSRLRSGDKIDGLDFQEREHNQMEDIQADHSFILNDSDEVEDKRVVKQAEAVTAILTMSKGGSRTITRRSTDDFLAQPDYLKTRVKQPQYTFGRNINTKDDDSSDPEYATQQNDGRDFSVVSAQIVNALHFRTLHEREEVIPEAYARTFEWIWYEANEENSTVENFPQWLRSGSGCYWVNGKAGAGKSTLMKYIHRDPALQLNLQEWCGPKELIIASFFFWRAGTLLQKTQVGLLRSLLFEVLDTRRELVPVLFPTVCRYLATRTIPDLSLSFHELRKATSILLNGLPEHLKLFLFIDGIDEYEGDQNDVLELFVPNTRTASVKALVSSRPTPVCTDTFDGCPSLRLQDLTVGDIARYVNGKLSTHKLLVRMEASPDGEGIRELLVTGITEKASGVFLWVILVVKSLLTGLRNSDTKDDLIWRLNILPPDLEALYKYMLGSMTLEYQRQASLLIRLVQRSSEIQCNQMTALQLSYAEEGQPLTAVEFPVQNQSIEYQATRCRVVEGRMRSRCCGLIEGQWVNRNYHYAEMRVGFLHRTVIDYLTEPTVDHYLKTLVSTSTAELDEILLSSNLKEMKIRKDRAFTFNVSNILKYASNLHSNDSARLIGYIDQMQSVAVRYTNREAVFYGWAWREMKRCQMIDLPNIDEEIVLPHPFCMLLAVTGLLQNLEIRIQADEFRENDKRVLLFHIVLAFLNAFLFDCSDFEYLASGLFSSSQCLLKLGLDPNAAVHIGPAFHRICFTPPENVRHALELPVVCADASGQISPWALINEFLTQLPDFSLLASSNLPHLCLLLQQMIVAQADLKLKIDVSGREVKARSIDILRKFIVQIEKAGLETTVSNELGVVLKRESLRQSDSLAPDEVTSQRRRSFRRLFGRSKD